MSEPITNLLAKLNNPNDIDVEGDLDELIDGAIIGCARHLQGLGEFVLSAGIGNEEGAIPGVAFGQFGNLISDLGGIIERCHLMKMQQANGKGGAE